MKVKELIEELDKYNQDADVKICVRGVPQEFEISYGVSENHTKLSCNCVTFIIETVYDEEGGATNE